MKWSLTLGTALAVAIAGLLWTEPSRAAQDVLGAGPCTLLERQTTCSAPKALPFYANATFTPSWNVKEAHRVGDFRFIDQSGRPFEARHLDNKITVVSFFYTTCNGICASNTQNLGWLQKRMARHPRVQLASHSVTGDSVAALARYARTNGVDGRRWRLLTGNLRDIDAVMRTAYFTYPAGDVGPKREAMHTENLLLIDGQRRIRGVYRGTLRLDVEALARDIEQLEAE